jgi:hypothetical protein
VSKYVELRKPGLELECGDGGELCLCKVPRIQGVDKKKYLEVRAVFLNLFILDEPLKRFSSVTEPQHKNCYKDRLWI